MPLKEGNTPWFHFDPVLFLPLWIGIWRWGAYLILKAIPSLLYKPIPISEELEQGHVPVSTQMMTMIIPVYMPEPGFEECLQSWVDNRPKTIVVVVDTNSYQQVGLDFFCLSLPLPWAGVVLGCCSINFFASPLSRVAFRPRLVKACIEWARVVGKGGFVRHAVPVPTLRFRPNSPSVLLLLC